MSAEGGTPKPITTPEDFPPLWPEILPGSQAVVFTVGRLAPAQRRGIWALSLESGRRRRLVEEVGIARYVRSGHLVYALRGSLLAAPFDLESLELTGPAVPVIQDAMMGLPEEPLIAHFAVSHTGTLAYLPGPVLATNLRTLVWVDREGREEGLAVEPRGYDWPRLSPDGSRLALGISELDKFPNDSGDVWIYHLARRTLSRLTFDPAHDGRPLWTPDGRRVVFRSLRDGPGRFNLFWKASDGTGRAERLTTNPNPDRNAHTFSPDGKRLLFTEDSDPGLDVQMLLLEERQLSKPLLQMPFNEASPAISPDGRWLAYRSNETGRYEIYVRPFPDVEKGKWQISTNGGNAPLWSPDGRELFYQNREAMMVAAVQASASFVAGSPKLLFTGTYVSGPAGSRGFDISRDGRRFIMIKEVEHKLEASARDELTVVLNWFEELRQLVPAKKGGE